MNDTIKRTGVSESQQRLIYLMQTINFGCIENLIVINGEPVLEPLPYIVCDIKFGSENGPRQETILSDFRLKHQVRELLGCIRKIKTGRIKSLEIKHGLPFRMCVEGSGLENKN